MQKGKTGKVYKSMPMFFYLICNLFNSKLFQSELFLGLVQFQVVVTLVILASDQLPTNGLTTVTVKRVILHRTLLQWHTRKARNKCATKTHPHDMKSVSIYYIYIYMYIYIPVYIYIITSILYIDINYTKEHSPERKGHSRAFPLNNALHTCMCHNNMMKATP